MNVLILGGTKYLGADLVDKLINGPSLCNISTVSRNKESPNKNKHFICERKDIASLAKIIEFVQPEVIVDTINYDKLDSQNIINLYEKGIFNKLRHYIVFSSFFIYQYFNLDQTREKKLNLNNIESKCDDKYISNKIKMELALYDSAIFNKTTILRLPFIFSSDDYTGRFQTLCQISLFGNLSNLDNKYKYSMISKEFASVNLKNIVFKKPLGIVDLGNRGCLTSRQLAKHINLFLNKKIFKNEIYNKTNPYPVLKNLCIYTKKIEAQKELLLDIEEQSIQYFKSINKLLNY